MVSMVAPVRNPTWPDRVESEWTVDMLDELPDDGRRYELLDGTLLVSPAPIPLHQQAVVELLLALSAACPSDHRVYVAPLDWQPDGSTSLQPDLLVVRKDRVGPRSITERPTLVVEIASPGSARIDRTSKHSRYAEGGIEQYWIVDPAVPSIRVYDLVDGDYVLQVESLGDAPLTVSGPIAVTVVPQQLVEP